MNGVKGFSEVCREERQLKASIANKGNLFKPLLAKPPAGSSLLFGALADSGRIKQRKNGKFRMVLKGVDEIDWFTDRPDRVEGTWKPGKLLRKWDKYFATSEPNAQVTFDIGDSRDIATFEMSKPRFSKNSDFIFKLKPLSKVSKAAVKKIASNDQLAENISLFIDDASLSGNLNVKTWSGNVRGNVIGDVTGNVVGNVVGTVSKSPDAADDDVTVTGNVKGDVTGDVNGNVSGTSTINGSTLPSCFPSCSDAKLSGIDLSKKSLITDFTKADLSNANLNGVNLNGADLNGADLTGADLTGADLTNANFAEANLTGANLADVILNGVNFGIETVERSTLANMSQLRSGGIKVSGASPKLPEGMKLTKGYLVFPGADLSGAFLAGADLQKTQLNYANLSKADLSDAVLSSANLFDANLKNAKLSRANFNNTNLKGANLSYTELANADLSDANLNETNLTGADLTDAILSDNTYMSGTIWNNTTCPDGTINNGTSPCTA